VWPFRVVVDPPCFNDPACSGQAVEEVLAEAFVANRRLNTLDEPVLLRLAGADVTPHNIDLFSCQHSITCDVSSVPLSLTTKRRTGACSTTRHSRL